MTRNALGETLCMAGREAFFGGRWNGIRPCTKVYEHRIESVADDAIDLPGPALAAYARANPGVVLHFCDEHFRQLHAAGLVPRAYVGMYVESVEGILDAPP